MDHNIADPVDDAYRAVVPELAREDMHNISSNFHGPIALANEVLQGEASKALNTIGRILINSTVGLGGSIDVANKFGTPHQDNDFGIMPSLDGIQEGYYLVLPFVGPMPPRDLLGSVVDGAFDPFSYARFRSMGTWMFARSGVRVLDTVDRNRDELGTIERTSLDFHAAMRNLYWQIETPASWAKMNHD
jgi:phospholipid-binding lipoprotein MlaA